MSDRYYILMANKISTSRIMICLLDVIATAIVYEVDSYDQSYS
ncbi:hypothetical protein HW555_000812 [Spodoptera exigua]|uniref:Uncharacterized protein n=1 Tax=Spodoptera exigua TaxID=7107 RepID=A0A835GTE5_SPOEX|nr:hypothetical protein HW555_000812 [Spodoptera exigua]